MTYNSFSSKPAELTQSVVRVASKGYQCAGHGRPCARRILRGQPYTQVSVVPVPGDRTLRGAATAARGAWTVRRICSACLPLADTDARVPLSCTYGSAESQCELTFDHPPPHQLAIGLF